MRLRLALGVVTIAAVASATGGFAGSMGAAGVAMPRAAAPKPTLSVAVLGRGSVTSTPAGISCPGRCVATFAAGSRVLLTPKAKQGSRFLRWGGNCNGTRACRVRVSALSAVAAQFVGGKTQPPPTRSVDPGTYSGGGFVSFYVPAGAGTVQNFTIPNIRVDCAGGGSYFTSPMILTTTIKADRSFTAKTSQSGVVDRASATITFSITGRFQGPDSSGRATAAGVYRADMVFTDTDRKCTSNDAPWTATRTLPPSKGPVEPGTYSGGGFVSFFVPGAGTVQNFTIPNIRVDCAGGGSYFTSPKILTTTIKADRSFTAKTSQSGVVDRASATITFSITGRFQGPDSSGRTTAGGVYRADIVFAGTPNRRCTSNDQPWTATRTGG